MPQLKNARSRQRRGKRIDRTQQSVERYAGDAYSLAKRSIAGLNQIRKLINIEEKYLDTSASVFPNQSGTSSVTCLSQITQGADISNRVGNSIRVQRLSLIGRTSVNSSVTTFSLVRILVFRDMEGQGTAPVMSDVLETVGSSAAPRQPYDYLNRKRFSILADWVFPLTPFTSGQGSAHEFQYDVPLLKHVLYRGGLAAAASDGEGSIYLGCVSDETTNTPNVAFTSRIVFTDD